MVLEVGRTHAERFLPRRLFRDAADDKIELEPLQRFHVRLFTPPNPLGRGPELFGQLLDELAFDASGSAAISHCPRRILDHTYAQPSTAYVLECLLWIGWNPRAC